MIVIADTTRRFSLRRGAETRTFEVKEEAEEMVRVVYSRPGLNGLGYGSREVTREKAREMYRGALQGGFKPI